jgi:hypothetical protein
MTAVPEQNREVAASGTYDRISGFVRMASHWHDLAMGAFDVDDGKAAIMERMNGTRVEPTPVVRRTEARPLTARHACIVSSLRERAT